MTDTPIVTVQDQLARALAVSDPELNHFVRAGVALRWLASQGVTVLLLDNADAQELFTCVQTELEITVDDVEEYESISEPEQARDARNYADALRRVYAQLTNEQRAGLSPAQKED